MFTCLCLFFRKKKQIKLNFWKRLTKGSTRSLNVRLNKYVRTFKLKLRWQLSLQLHANDQVIPYAHHHLSTNNETNELQNLMITGLTIKKIDPTGIWPFPCFLWKIKLHSFIKNKGKAKPLNSGAFNIQKLYRYVTLALVLHRHILAPLLMRRWFDSQHARNLWYSRVLRKRKKLVLSCCSFRKRAPLLAVHTTGAKDGQRHKVFTNYNLWLHATLQHTELLALQLRPQDLYFCSVTPLGYAHRALYFLRCLASIE